MPRIPSADELVDIARRRTGLDELGDPRFRVALGELVRSINDEATVTVEGAPAATERLLRLLVNRLRFEADVARVPAIRDEPLRPPLIICGLPRVGSTKLHRLLAEGGDFQSLLFWQGFNPAPVPGSPGGDDDPRIAEAVRFLEWRSRLNPAADAAHHMAALEPEEDTYLLEYTLHTYWPTSYFNVPGFLALARGAGSRRRVPLRARAAAVPAVAVSSRRAAAVVAQVAAEPGFRNRARPQPAWCALRRAAPRSRRGDPVDRGDRSRGAALVLRRTR